MSCVECSVHSSHNPKRTRPHSWHNTEFCNPSPHTSNVQGSEERRSQCESQPQSSHVNANDADSKFQVGLFEVDRTIGIGNYSVVKHAVHRILRNEVAIKIVDKTMLDSDSLSRVTREIEILKRLRHPYVIHLYQIIETDSHLYIVTEYASEGELYEYIKRKKKLDEGDARRLFWQLVSAVEYCHQHGVSHRDIKAENVLIDSNGRLKLADFGFSNFHAKDYYSRTFCGSPPYAAPEIFNGTAYLGPQADIWSLGVTLYVMATGTMPFNGNGLHELKAKVLQGQFRIPYYMSPELENLLRRMLCTDPKKRITIAQIKEHSWVHKDSYSDQVRQEVSAFQVVSSSDATVACINIMKGLGVPHEKINSSLNSMEYDHVMCLFLLLMERYRKRNFTAALSMIKEQDVMSRGIFENMDSKYRRSCSSERSKTRPLLKQLRGHPQFGTTDTVSSLGTSSSISRQSTNTVDSVDEGVDFSLSADYSDGGYPLRNKKISEIQQSSVNGSEGAIMAARILKENGDDFRSSENNVADSFPTGNIGDRTNEIASLNQSPNNDLVSHRMELLSLSQRGKPILKGVPKRLTNGDGRNVRKPPQHKTGYARTLPYNILQRGGPQRMHSVPTEPVFLSGN